MAKSNKIILPPESVLALQTAQRELADLLPELDKAEDCGIECQELRAAVQEKMRQAESILANFGPAIQPKR